MTSVPERRLARIYIRESKDELLRGYSPDEMVRQCREKAEQLGADVDRVIIEAGKRDEFDCPGLLDTIDAAKGGQYEVLISYDMYRLSGELMKHLWVKESFGKTAVTIHYVVGEYPPTAEGELMETVQAGVGRYERVKTRMRTQNGIMGKLKREQPMCNGVAPYGLAKVYDAKTKRPIGYRPTEQILVLRRIVRELQTETLLVVCRRLNDEGVPTPSGTGRWASGTVMSLLNNETYTGTYRWGRTKQTPGRRPDGRRVYHKERRADEDTRTFGIAAALDPVELAAARAAMARRTRDRRPTRPAEDDPFILRGLIECGYCHGVLSCTVNNGYRRYTCLRAYGPDVDADDRCPLPQVAADGLELEAWDRFVVAMQQPCVREDIERATEGGDAARRHAEQIEAVRRGMAAAVRRVANAVERLVHIEPGSLSAEAFERQRIEAERDHAELAAGLTRLEGAAPPVLSRPDADALLALHAELLAGILQDGLAPAGRRMWLRRGDLSGTISLGSDGAGVRLGRKHSYTLAWRGHLRPLSGGGKDTQGCLLLWDSLSTPTRLELGALRAS